MPAIGYPIAYWISRYGGRHKAILLILVMLPFWTSYLIRTYAWMIILRDNGVANSILQALGLTSEPIILLNTDFSVILGMTYGFLPFAILPLFVSIDRLDAALVPPARDLYANGRQAFLNVTLPLTMPGIVAASILTFIPAIGDFVTPDLLGGAETTTIAKVVQELFLEGRDWPYGSALGFVLMVITLGGTFLALRPLRREVVGRDPMTGRNRWLTAFAVADLCVPVRPDRRAHRLLVQRLRAQLPVEGLHPRLVPDGVRQRGPARGAVRDAPGRLSSRSSCRRSSGPAGPGAGASPVPWQDRHRDAPARADGHAGDRDGPQPAHLLLHRCQRPRRFWQLSIAHITFCVSYVAIVVRARAAGMDPRLEEAARDLGASASAPSATSRCRSSRRR